MMSSSQPDDRTEEGTMTETKLVRRGDAVPVDPDTGAPAYDAPAATHETTREPTAHVLAAQEGSPESEMLAHRGGHGVGGYVTTGDDTSSDSSWPRRHAALDELACAHGSTFSQDGLTVDEKIAELKSMNITPEAT